MTFKEFIKLAEKNYNKGGDGYVECWCEEFFNEYVANFGEITEKEALKMFARDYEIERDREGWF